MLQQISSGLSRYSLVTSSNLAKQEKFNGAANSEEQIVEMREFLGQFVIDIVRKLKDNPRIIPIVNELLEVNYKH